MAGYKTYMDEELVPPAPKPEVVDPDQVNLFSGEPKAPPTGPLADPYHHADNQPDRFVKFLQSEEGAVFMGRAESEAIVALSEGSRRFSVLGYLHLYRSLYKERVNNSFAPWVADELVARRPELIDIIERRTRRKQGPSMRKGGEV